MKDHENTTIPEGFQVKHYNCRKAYGVAPSRTARGKPAKTGAATTAKLYAAKSRKNVLAYAYMIGRLRARASR